MTGELIPTGVTFGVGRNSLNDAFSGTATLNNITLDSGGNLAAGVGGGIIYSAGTDLYSIFVTSDSTTADNGLTKVGDKISLGGALTGDTILNGGGAYSFELKNMKYFSSGSMTTNGGDFSGGTGGGVIYSAGTDLYNIFATSDSTTASNGLTKTGDNITLGGTLTGDTTIDLSSNVMSLTGGSTNFLKGISTPSVAGINSIVSTYFENYFSTAPGTSVSSSYNVAYLADIPSNDAASQMNGHTSAAIWNQSTTGVSLTKDVSLAGIQVRSIIVSAGTASHAAGIVSKVYTADALGTIDVGYGLKTEIGNLNVGTVNEFRGVYITDMSGTPGVPSADKRYGIYQLDDGNNSVYDIEVRGDLSGGTGGGVIYSGGTDLYNIFATSDSTTASNGLTKTGDNITLGGTLTAATTINLDPAASLSIVKTAGTGSVFSASDGAGLNSAFVPGRVGVGDNTASIGMSMDISQSGISYSDTFIGGGTQILKFIAPSSFTTETISLPQDKSGIVALTSDVISGSGGTATEDFIYDLGSTYQYKISGDSGSPVQITLESNFISSDPTRLTVGRSITEMISSSGASVQARIKVESGVPSMIKTAGGATQQFSFQSVGNQMKIIDGINQTGLEYGGNYHGNYTNRTLVDYEYVNNHVASATTGGGVTIDPYNDLGDVASSFTWNVSGDSTNYEVTLTAATTTVNLTNVRNGEYGTVVVNQDTTGGRNISFGTVNGAGATHKVVNSGGGSATLTATASAIDILTFTYNGSTMFWSVGNDYT